MKYGDRFIEYFHEKFLIHWNLSQDPGEKIIIKILILEKKKFENIFSNGVKIYTGVDGANNKFNC